MRLGLICYHRDALSRYPAAWLEAYRQSIYAQQLPVEVFELDYGGGQTRLLKGSTWLSIRLPTHVDAQNALLDVAFGAGCDGVINTNCDDVYAREYTTICARSLSQGFDLAASNFDLIDEDDRLLHRHDDFHRADLRLELAADRNPICHPTTVYSRAFWAGCSRYDPAEIPCEDLRLWQREIGRFRFGVAPETLVAHRVHDRSVCAEAARASSSHPRRLQPSRPSRSR